MIRVLVEVGKNIKSAAESSFSNEVTKMLKEYLDKNKISIYQLSKSAQIPYSTLNDLVNKKMDGKNCSTGTIKKLAAALGMSMDQVLNCVLIHVFMKKMVPA